MDKLMLNGEKTEFIVNGTRQQLVKFDIDSLCGGRRYSNSSLFRSEKSWGLV